MVRNQVQVEVNRGHPLKRSIPPLSGAMSTAFSTVRLTQNLAGSLLYIGERMTRSVRGLAAMYSMAVPSFAGPLHCAC